MRLTLIVSLVALLVGGASGATLAWKLKAGKVAIEQNKDLREQADRLVNLATDQSQQLATRAGELTEAVTRLNGISQGREDDRNRLDFAAAALVQDLDELRRATPALATCELGDGFLRHWNKANRAVGDGADPAGSAEPAPDAASEPDRIVPSTPAAVQGDAGGSLVATRQGSADVPGLRKSPVPATASSAGMGGNQLALVLPRVETAVAAAAEVLR